MISQDFFQCEIACEMLERLQGFYSYDFEEFYVKTFSFVSRIICLLQFAEKENIVWLKRKLNYLIENSNKLNVVGWSIKKNKNEEKLEEIVNDFDGKKSM
jgi:hypothetical protein